MADPCIPPIVEVFVTNQPVQPAIVQQTAQQVVSQQTAQQVVTQQSVSNPAATNTLDQVLTSSGTVVQPVGPAGPQGPTGPAGPTQAVFTAVAAVNLFSGTPVYVDQVTKQLKPADSNTFNNSRVVGLAAAFTLAGFQATVEQTSLTLSDWTQIVGAVALVAGQNYFLGANGTLTTTAPNGAGSTVVFIGTAVKQDTLAISFSPSVML